MHNAFLDQVLPQATSDEIQSDPRTVAGAISRVAGTGASCQVWAILDDFDPSYEWGPLDHEPFAPGEAPVVGARCAVGVFDDEKWLLAVGNTALTAATWYSVSGVPSSGIGAEGDLALDYTGNAWYGPKHLGSWGAAHTLVPVVLPFSPHPFLLMGA